MDGVALGPEYAAGSNVDNAAKLQGKLLLVLGEMDSIVDPAVPRCRVVERIDQG
jgi:hypothetical protein